MVLINMFDKKDFEYDSKYSDIISKYELQLDVELNKNNVFKGGNIYEIY